MKSNILLSLLLLLLSIALCDSQGPVEPDEDKPNTFQSEDACSRDTDCTNGGTCKLSGEHSSLFNRCSCKDGYGGDICETYCPLKCQNGGSCRPKDSDYECVCHGRWTGDLCHIPFQVCQDHTMCLHGGTCALANAETNEYGCDCPPGFDGDRECAINPNHGMTLDELEDDVEAVMTPRILFAIVLGVVLGVSCTILALRSCSRHRGYRLNVNAAKSQTDAFDATDLASSSMHDVQII